MGKVIQPLAPTIPGPARYQGRDSTEVNTLVTRLGMLKKLFVLIFTTIGGSIGWAAGASIEGTMTAFVLSMIGTGIGMYAGFKAAERYTP